MVNLFQTSRAASKYSVGENDIGAPKMQNNFQYNTKLLIFDITISILDIFCFLYNYCPSNCTIVEVVALNIFALICLGFVHWFLITIHRAIKKRSKEIIPKIKQSSENSKENKVKYCYRNIVKRKNLITPNLVSTGWRDQIVRSVNLILLPKQKTCRKCKDSFGIVSNRAKKYVFG